MSLLSVTGPSEMVPAQRMEQRRQWAMPVLVQTVIVWMQSMAQGTRATALKDMRAILISPKAVKVKYLLRQNFFFGNQDKQMSEETTLDST